MANNIEDEIVAKASYDMLESMAKGEMSLESMDDITPTPEVVREARFAIPPSTRPIASSSPSSLCSVCSSMTAEALETEHGYFHVDDVRILESSARTCASCNLIQTRIRRAAMITSGDEADGRDLEAALQLTAISVQEQGAIPQQPWRVALKLTPRGVGFDRVSIKLYIPVLAPIGGRMYRSGVFVHNFGHLCLHSQAPDEALPLLPRGTDTEILQRLLQWLQRSASEAALRIDSSKAMPTRVLDLGRDNSWDSDLRLASSAGKSDQYATLSYCWGTYTGCRTLKDNLKLRESNIVFSELPKAFAQAVKVTRALGIRYLWIDALCIIQDDEKDWIREASQMAEIYLNGHCRLAITAGKDPTEGFFPPQELLASVAVPNLKHADTNGELFQCYLTHPKHYITDVDQGYLNTRGWVLQERLLAPRTIHFTRDHIYCEDQDDICGEDWVRRHFTWMSCIEKTSRSARSNLFPEEKILPKAMKSFVHGSEDPWLIRSFSAQGSYRHMASGCNSWLEIARNFSSCRLAYPKDKLISMAGLIKRKQTNPESQYFESRNFLGLWEKTLQIDLCWTKQRSNKLKYIDSLNLPSWSWVSYDGPITFVQDQRNARDLKTVGRPPIAEFELVDSDVPQPSDMLPHSKRASLNLHLTVRKMGKISELPKSPKSYETLEKLCEDSPFNLDPHGAIPESLYDKSESKIMLNDTCEHIGYVSFDQEDVLSSQTSLYCALIATIWQGSASTTTLNASSISFSGGSGPISAQALKSPILAYGLLLKLIDPSENEYVRMGIVQVNYGWISEGTKKVIRLI
jgi:hypothetical protein